MSRETEPPGRTDELLAEGEDLGSNLLHVDQRDLAYGAGKVLMVSREAPGYGEGQNGSPPASCRWLSIPRRPISILKNVL
jgi:hypothetical protein